MEEHCETLEEFVEGRGEQTDELALKQEELNATLAGLDQRVHEEPEGEAQAKGVVLHVVVDPVVRREAPASRRVEEALAADLPLRIQQHMTPRPHD